MTKPARLRSARSGLTFGRGGAASAPQTPGEGLTFALGQSSASRAAADPDRSAGPLAGRWQGGPRLVASGGYIV